MCSLSRLKSSTCFSVSRRRFCACSIGVLTNSRSAQSLRVATKLLAYPISPFVLRFLLHYFRFDRAGRYSVVLAFGITSKADRRLCYQPCCSRDSTSRRCSASRIPTATTRLILTSFRTSASPTFTQIFFGSWSELSNTRIVVQPFSSELPSEFC